jgi:Flp pilus assembly protein TadG
MKMPRRYLGRKGNAMLEFALSAGILFPAFVGTFQFGYTFYIYNNLNTAARGGARYASMQSYDSASSTPSTAFATAVKNVVVYGNSAGTGDPVVSGLGSGNVQVVANMKGAIPASITVSITGYQIDAVFTSFTFNGKPSTTFAYTGTAAPPTS